jgi:hypothetical protein
METVQRILFENPTALYVALIVGEIALIATWFKYRDRRKLLYLLVPPALGLAVYTVERLVVTDHEQILLNCRTIARAIEADDLDAVVPYLDTTLTGTWQTREDAIKAGKVFLAANRIQSIRLNFADFQPANHRAEMFATSYLEFSTGEAAGRGATPLAWRIHWIQKGGRWIIDDVDFKVGVKY